MKGLEHTQRTSHVPAQSDQLRFSDEVERPNFTIPLSTRVFRQWIPLIVSFTIRKEGKLVETI